VRHARRNLHQLRGGSGAASRAEGAPDGRVSAAAPDSGFIALNTGVLWLEIGSVSGDGPAQEIRSGDTVQVYEIDRYYVEVGSATECLCPPDGYGVYAYVSRDLTAERIALLPIKYQPENATSCGTSPSAALGCGTTEFRVP
jgi:hypothetical protein